MTRIQADFALLMVAFIWGTAFIAQKAGMDGLGPLAFVGVRFLMSSAFVLPFVFRERTRWMALSRRDVLPLVILCISFAGGAILQQVGIKMTSVTNAGFLTSLYVLGVPLVAWVIFRVRPPAVTWVCCCMALMGVWFLNGGSLSSIGPGDIMIIGCAVCFAIQVALVGLMVQRTNLPLTLSLVQYAFCAVIALACAGVTEDVSLDVIARNFWPLFYAGVISGGIAFTLQAVAQRYTPPADAAVILASEGLFAAMAGAMIYRERLGAMGFAGCGLIMAAILTVEMVPVLKKSLSRTARAG